MEWNEEDYYDEDEEDTEPLVLSFGDGETKIETMADFKRKEEFNAIKETQMWAVAGLSLNRPISPEDIRWAVEKGFEAGINFYKKQNGIN